MYLKVVSAADQFLSLPKEIRQELSEKRFKREADGRIKKFLLISLANKVYTLEEICGLVDVREKYSDLVLTHLENLQKAGRLTLEILPEKKFKVTIL